MPQAPATVPNFCSPVPIRYGWTPTWPCSTAGRHDAGQYGDIEMGVSRLLLGLRCWKWSADTMKNIIALSVCQS